MATSNEKLRNRLIEHQTYLLRLSAFYGNEMIKAVDKSIPMLMAEINQLLEDIEDMGGYVPSAKINSRIRKFESATFALRSERFDDYQAFYTKEMGNLAVKEGLFTAKFIEGALPAGVTVKLAQPGSQSINRLLKYENYDGRTLNKWFSDLKQADTNRIITAVRDGVRQGLSNQQIARTIRGTRKARFTDGILQTTRNQSMTIARTITNGIANGARQNFAKANSDIIEREIYVATLDSRTTLICASLDGESFPVGEGEIPPLHPNCRSLRVPVIKGANIVGVRPFQAEVIGQVPAKVSFPEWLKDRPKKFQDDYLGPARAIEFRAGRLTLEKMVDQSGRPITLKELGLTVKRG